MIAIPPKHAVAKVVKHLKGASAHHINHSLKPDGHFQWQRGYGVWTLGESQRPMAEDYVVDQKSYHRQVTINKWLELTTYAVAGVSPPVPANMIRERSTAYQAAESYPF